MITLLPFLGVGLVFLAVIALWARRSSANRRGATEVLEPREPSSSPGSAARQEDLGERIFGSYDWDFVSRETPSAIQRMFERERTPLAISWLRRTRRQVSRVMSTHAAGVRRSANLQPAMELRLLLSYLSLVILCDFLIGLVWLRGPIHTRRLVRSTVQLTSRLRSAFEQCMAVVDPAPGKTLETRFNQGRV